MNDTPEVDAASLTKGLRLIRRRRWYLWAVILVYMPAMIWTLKLTGSNQAATVVFAVWFVVLFIIALVVAVTRCPRCGNYFHMHGFTLLPLRKCLHCQLPLMADKNT